MKKTFLLLTLLLPSLNLLAYNEADYQIVKKYEYGAEWPKSTWNNKNFAYLRGADLFRADLRGADLFRAYLRGANLARADLQKANLTEANLTSADLQKANLRFANLKGANLKGAYLKGAYLFKADLGGASCNEKTTLPSSFTCTSDNIIVPAATTKL